MQPTHQAYGELQVAYDYFNGHIFDNALPGCLFTLQRKRRAYGYFARARFINQTGTHADEIAMNPFYFGQVGLTEIMQTLVHEMAHQWQFHYGKPGRRGYHNKEWGTKMESIGLMPSTTGKPGGKKTGERMADYVINNGHFDRTCARLLSADFLISWSDHLNLIAQTDNEGEESDGELTVEAPKQTRLKYHCPGCKANAWGKKGLQLVCGRCKVDFRVKNTSKSSKTASE